jgi:energy-coupling factor transporter ATP-binding protein EcfA2
VNCEIKGLEEHKMIVMNIYLDNFMAFKNFHMNMSYPKKIVNSYIEEEFLKDHPNFRYKKVNILMGANASGKTSFGRMLMNIFNFMDKKEMDRVTRAICDTSKKATFSIDFITIEGDCLYRVTTRIDPKTKETYKDTDVNICVNYVKIGAKDSYESCSKRLSEQDCTMNKNFVEELGKIKGLSWLFEYPADFGVVNKYSTYGSSTYLKVLENTLKALDTSIVKVERLRDVEKSFVIRMKNQDVIMQDGELTKGDILSSGTKAGIAIAGIITAIINGDNGFYYCDEKFSYIHTDIEKAFLSLMIQCLRKNDQLFFTTHNTDILDLPLPKHTFTFLKKDVQDDTETIKSVNASEFLKRSTDSVKNAVENDLFSAAPSTELIYQLEELK